MFVPQWQKTLRIRLSAPNSERILPDCTDYMSCSLPRSTGKRIGAIRWHSLPSIGSYVQLLAEFVLISASRKVPAIAASGTLVGKAGDGNNDRDSRTLTEISHE